MALSLKRKRKCRVVAPNWLTVGELFPITLTERTIADIADKLQELLIAEKTNKDAFEKLPRRFMEVSKVLLDV
jgi:GINS complex subunit 2